MIRRSLQIAIPAVVVVLLAVGLYRVMHGTGMISERIGEVVHDPMAQQLDLATLTSFGWDRFYYFKAGTTRDEICAFIQARANRCAMYVRYDAVPDDSNALLFSLSGQLTHMELHALANGEFDVTAGRAGFPKDGAVFRIRRGMSGTRERIVLEPR